MKRFEIYANFRFKPRKKFMPLWKDRRTYKTDAYATKVMREQSHYYPELRFRVVEVEIHECPECKQAIKR